jgi:hypothetical protein
MDRLGTISFQTNDDSDVFLVEEVGENNTEPSDENLFGVDDPQFDSDMPWVTGRVPMIKPVTVEGDTASINAWSKGDPDSYRDNKSFVITIYVEYEEAEVLVNVETEKEHGADEKTDLDPQILEL